MNISKILENVYYVGINDRTTTRFEGLWPLPYGVSYNSYIVKDDKTALIDTVDKCGATKLIDNISRVTSGASIDYIIVNHMEPDHSGALKSIIDIYPEAKIVCSNVAVPMIKGFYGINDDSRFHIVKEGEEINLGKQTLKFSMIPMVHWPETMVTYLKESKILFSGDAFGTFGALNSGIIDSQTDTSVYFEEMYRYYSNIVGKYGRFVQKALNKLSALELNYICPTHGPVWHNEISKAIEITNRLSKYESEDGVTIVYGSMYGNTAIAVEAIAKRLSDSGIEKVIVHNASYSEMSDMISDVFRYKGLIICSPTYSGEIFPPIASLMSALKLRELKNKVVAVLGSYTWASSADKKLKQIIEEMGLDLTGTVSMAHTPNDDTYKQINSLIDSFAEKVKEQL